MFVITVLAFNKVHFPARWVCRINIPLCGMAIIFRENEDKIGSRSCLQIGWMEMRKATVEGFCLQLVRRK